MTLPEDFPVIPLTGGILFPQAFLPVRILDPRYKLMLEETLAGHRIFAVGAIRDIHAGTRKEQIHDMVGLGIIRSARVLPDGSTEIVLQGLARARVERFIGGKPYPRAKIKIIPRSQEESVVIDALQEKVVELTQRVADLDESITEMTLEFLMQQKDPGTLSDLVSCNLLSDWHDQQHVLESIRLSDRLRIVISGLLRRLHRLEILQDVEERFPDGDIRLN